MSVTLDFAVRAPLDGATAAAFDLAGSEVVLAAVGFAVLFVVFGLRSRGGAGERSHSCGACDGGACGSGRCDLDAVPRSGEEAPS